MYLLLVWVAKIIQNTSRLFGNSGAAAPGLFIERVRPTFLETGLRKLSDGVVVVSGTNGKTTTTKMIAECLSDAGKRVLTNRTGSNMTRGLISLLVSHSTLLGRLNYDIAVLEVDEAYAAILAKRLPIRAVVLLNVMRDQLDRFGEIDSTAQHLAALSQAARDFVVLNAHDPRIAALAHSAPKVTFGADSRLRNQFISDDDWHATSSEQSHHTDDQLADYLLEASDKTSASVRFGSKSYKLRLQMSGVHNHLNAVVALATLQRLLPIASPEVLISSLNNVAPAFGRGESIRVGRGHLQLLLVKNPSSFMQTVRTAPIRTAESVTVAINDAYADSRDVSWLWDIGVDEFLKAKHLHTAGSRGADMAVRFKYSGISIDRNFQSFDDLIAYTTHRQGNHLVFCTYTAMLRIRKLLVKKGYTRKVV